MTHTSLRSTEGRRIMATLGTVLSVFACLFLALWGTWVGFFLGGAPHMQLDGSGGESLGWIGWLCYTVLPLVVALMLITRDTTERVDPAQCIGAAVGLSALLSALSWRLVIARFASGPGYSRAGGLTQHCVTSTCWPLGVQDATLALPLLLGLVAALACSLRATRVPRAARVLIPAAVLLTSALLLILLGPMLLSFFDPSPR